MLNGYIAKEPHPKLREIAQTLRDAGSNQLQRIMEIILVVEVEAPAGNGSLDRPESSLASNGSNGLPRHPSETIKLRRKADMKREELKQAHCFALLGTPRGPR